MIKQAIIPLAGLGTRMLPLTSVMPKELMPINGKPNLQYILDECIDAGVKEFVFIISNFSKLILDFGYKLLELIKTFKFFISNEILSLLFSSIDNDESLINKWGFGSN